MNLFFLLLFFSCAKSFDQGELALDEVAFSDAVLASPTWNDPIYQIVESKCSSCHTVNRNQFVPSNTPNSFDDIDDESFFTTNRAEILARIQDESFPMPPTFATPLSSRESEALIRYINSL